MTSHFYKRLSEILKIYLLLLSVFLIFRIVFLCTYGNLIEIFQNFKGDLLKTFWIGFRCDTVVLCFALCVPLSLNVLSFFFLIKQSWTEGFNRFLYFFNKIYYIILFVIIFLINTIDFFYYRNFQTHFDNRVFGIVEDGTKEVMASVWSDYPVVILIVIFLLALFGWIKIVQKIQLRGRTWFQFNKFYAHIIVVILFVGFWLWGARSSLSVFPFRKNDLVFSVNLRLNDAAANGVYKLKEAISERISDSLHLSAHELLSQHGFGSLEEAKNDWDAGIMTDSCTIFDRITTPYNSFLEEHPPNIVIVLMEGWSSDFFNYNSPKFNTLGAFETEMPHLIFYPFCFPVNFGTIAAMETFFTNNVGATLSMSEYSNIPLKSSSAVIFKKAGYETSYFTAGYNGWRNVGNYCRTQGFDNVCGAEYMKTLLSNTEETEWGVFDQYLYDGVLNKLQNADSQPQFMICMTISNHSPHKIPLNYQPYSLQFPEKLSARTTKDMQQTLSSMQTFQYANDCLGKFLNNVRNSSLGENTIVVITGDHAMRGGLAYPDHELLYDWAVPLAFYIPENYARQLNKDTTRLVSHKDILPTIYNLAFSNFNYSATGDNIFDSATADNSFLITQTSWVLGKVGCINLNSHQSFTWQENSYYLQPAEHTPELEALRKKANVWLFGMKWQIYTELKKDH